MHIQRAEVEFHLRHLLQHSREPSVELLVDAIAKNEGKALHMPQTEAAVAGSHISESSEWLSCKPSDIVLIWCQSLFREQHEGNAGAAQPTSKKIVWLALVESIVSSNAMRIVRLEKVCLFARHAEVIGCLCGLALALQAHIHASN